MILQYLLVMLLLTVASSISVFNNKLTATAGIAGWFIGLLIFAGSGWLGITMLSAFFLLGTVSTSFGKEKKQRLGLASGQESKRTLGQVFANAGVAALLCLGMMIVPSYKDILMLMMAASFASATADTMSSELGNVFGTNYINIISFKKDKRGMDGVISLEGTLIGIAGSIVIASFHCFFKGNISGFFIIIIAGTFGNIFDSILGATAERKKLLTNNGVNFLNTLAGSITALFMKMFF